MVSYSRNLEMTYYQQQPFSSPQIPFTGSIQGGLQEGKSITVSGRVLPGANRFHVNLQCGSRPDADIALHFNPRYDSKTAYIVTNSRKNSNYGTEERIHQALFPMGNHFNLHVVVTSYSYKISVNGNHVMDFKHHIPFNMVDTIVVDGMVEVYTISFQDAAVPSVAAQASYSMPYKTTIIGGLQPGKNISIQGVVNPHASRFEINLRHRSGVAFHYNPRFPENLVVCNSLTNGQWGSEERSGEMPFHTGQNFHVIITCNPHHYNVFVNGKQVQTYNHRFTNLWEINVLEVSGDLSLTDVKV